MSTLDSIFRDANTTLFDLDSKAGTLREPYTVTRTDGAELSPQVKTTAAAGGSSLVVEEASAARVSGVVPAGLTFTIAGHAATYTVQADAVYASKAVTLSISPVLEAEATAADAVTYSGHVTHGVVLTADTSGYRYRENTISISESRPGLDIGTRIVEIEIPAGATDPQKSWLLYDSAGAKVCKLGRILDRQPESILAEAA